MQTDTNESYRSSPGNSKLPNGTTSFMTRSCLPWSMPSLSFGRIVWALVPFVIYTDHASLRTATNSPHLSQWMARWLSFFAEYSFRVDYKPGKLNVLADAMSRRSDYELAHITRVTTDLYDRIHMAHRNDESLASLVRFLAAGEEAKSE
ncbi:hypothetical protein PC128_g5942 [Phytophthora cactorum]|nr:hypothetical protein PC128_g5942 [Phytophthora cactorum]